MKIEEIYELWEADSYIDPTNIASESLKTPKLHHKYMKILSPERMLLKKIEQDYKTLYRDKSDYYTGKLETDKLKAYGWSPNPRIYLKLEIPMLLDADEELSKMTLKIAYQKEKVTTLESIITNISKRGFDIKNHIDMRKFESGQ